MLNDEEGGRGALVSTNHVKKGSRGYIAEGKTPHGLAQAVKRAI